MPNASSDSSERCALEECPHDFLAELGNLLDGLEDTVRLAVIDQHRKDQYTSLCDEFAAFRQRSQPEHEAGCANCRQAVDEFYEWALTGIWLGAIDPEAVEPATRPKDKSFVRFRTHARLKTLWGADFLVVLTQAPWHVVLPDDAAGFATAFSQWIRPHLLQQHPNGWTHGKTPQVVLLDNNQRVVGKADLINFHQHKESKFLPGAGSRSRRLESASGTASNTARTRTRRGRGAPSLSPAASSLLSDPPSSSALTPNDSAVRSPRAVEQSRKQRPGPSPLGTPELPESSQLTSPLSTPTPIPSDPLNTPSPTRLLQLEGTPSFADDLEHTFNGNRKASPQEQEEDLPQATHDLQETIEEPHKTPQHTSTNAYPLPNQHGISHPTSKDLSDLSNQHGTSQPTSKGLDALSKHNKDTHRLSEDLNPLSKLDEGLQTLSEAANPDSDLPSAPHSISKDPDLNALSSQTPSSHLSSEYFDALSDQHHHAAESQFRCELGIDMGSNMASTGTPRNQGVRRSADRILQEVPSAHQTFWGPLEEALKKTFADCTFHEKRLENARIARNRERDASGYGLDTPLRVLESINGGIAAAQRILNQTTAVLETVNPEHERNIPQVAQYAADLRAKVKTEETIIRSCEGQVVRLRKAIQVVEEEQRALDEAKRKHEEQMCWIDDAAQRLEEMKQSYAWKDDGKKDAAK